MLDALRRRGTADRESTSAPIGGAGYDAAGHPLPEATLELARAADAVLLGAVGGPKYDTLPRELRPEQGILGLRKALGLFANLRPALLYPELAGVVDAEARRRRRARSLHRARVDRRHLFRRSRADAAPTPPASAKASTRCVYQRARSRVSRASASRRRASAAAGSCSVDKANVLDTSILWREVVTEVAADYPDVALSHMYVDNAAMQLVRAPKSFDVIVTGNLFGDILSDEASMLAGSIGMLPSASLDANGKGLYEPIHGSAPDIAGQDRANPLATILSVAMMFRHTFARADVADRIEAAVRKVLRARACAPRDIAAPGERVVGTRAMGDCGGRGAAGLLIVARRPAIVVRRAEARDAEAIARPSSAAGDRGNAAVAVSFARGMGEADRGDPAGDYLLVAEIDGEVVGNLRPARRVEVAAAPARRGRSAWPSATTGIGAAWYGADARRDRPRRQLARLSAAGADGLYRIILRRWRCTASSASRSKALRAPMRFATAASRCVPDGAAAPPRLRGERAAEVRAAKARRTKRGGE